MNVRFMGDAAFLVETQGPAEAQVLRRVLLQESIPGLRQLVPGQRSLLVAADPLLADLEELARRIPRLARVQARSAGVRQHAFSVRYDGEDLVAAARRLHIETAELVRRHTAPVYTVAFLGFAPGFPYLTGLDPGLQLPRRSDPRLQVPAGSVALAGEFCGIYPQATPGGWNVIGRCQARLFDPAHAQPALLVPGDQVRFRAAP